MKEKPGSNVSRLGNELERRLIIMRYSKVSTKKYMKVFGWLKDYLYGYGETNYTKELGQRFLIEYPLQAIHSPSEFKEAQVTIRRIDEILENNLFVPRFHKANSECPPHFTGMRDKYIENLAKRGYRESTIINCKIYAGRLLGRLPETVLSVEDLSAADLYEVFTKHEWHSAGLAAARSFLSFLFETGGTKINLTACVPRPIRPRPLPSVYSGDEVKRLLSSVDRTTSLGKRDYAILVLAEDLGLCSSDIAGLSFKDVDYRAKTIEIIQVKTARPVKLVMNREAEEAITDYIKNGRPQPSREESDVIDATPPCGPAAGSGDKIFLRSRAPFSPLAADQCHAIANKYFNLAGIAAQGRKRGPHALRASYATVLVAKGVPYAVVQEALGHGDQESAKYYVRVDARRLRMCALDVPKPAGAFAVALGDLEGVL
jgi:site-specific recombinase XerD